MHLSIRTHAHMCMLIKAFTISTCSMQIHVAYDFDSSVQRVYLKMSVAQWVSKWGMSFHPDKCNVL